jgi:hypothetical protein
MRNFSQLKYFCKGYKKRMQYTFGYFTERWGVRSFFQFHVLDTCRHGRHMGFLVFLFQYDVDGCSQVLDEVSCVASIQHDAVCNLGNFNCMTFSTCFSWPWGNGEEIGIELEWCWCRLNETLIVHHMLILLYSSLSSGNPMWRHPAACMYNTDWNLDRRGQCFTLLTAISLKI